MPHVDLVSASSSWGPALLTGGALLIFGIVAMFAEAVHHSRPDWMAP